MDWPHFQMDPKDKPSKSVSLSDPDNVQTIILCHHCRQPLWDMKILKRFGDRVASTEFKPHTPEIPKFSGRTKDCPKCGKPYYHVSKRGEPIFTMADPKTGELILI